MMIDKSGEMPLIEEVMPRFYRVEVPLPDNPLKSVNSYMIKSKDRNLIIDTGMNRKPCFEAMTTAIKKLSIDMEKTDIFITHYHIDHVGLANRLIAPTSKCYFNRQETELRLSETLTQWANRVSIFAAKYGFYEKGIKDVKTGVAEEDARIQYPKFTILNEGDILNAGDYSFRCIETPGHSLGHLCLYERERKVFISGDHILGDITPNISTRFNDENPLQEYINSLDKVYPLEVKLCLPGHRSLIRNFQGRIDELKHHHEERADEIVHILGSSKLNAYQIASKMKWDMTYETFEEFPVFPKWFAFSEALSHLQYLENRGRVTRIMMPDEKVFYCNS